MRFAGICCRKAKKKTLSCIETLNEKWSWGSEYLTSQTAQSLEALASVKSPTKSSALDMASFTCLTTVKQEERAERKDRAERCERWLELEKKKSESTENIKVLMFLTESPATSVRDSLLYLARIILFRASMSAVVVFVFVCLSSRAHPNIWGGSGGGGVGSGRGNIKSRFRSPSANRSECLP